MVRHYLVDTNVIIDMLVDRDDADAACAVMDGAERGEYFLYLCALSYTNIYYSLRKILSHEKRISCLSQLSELLSILPVDGRILQHALQSDWKDFEDAVQYFTAKSNPLISGIITRNIKDFRLSELEIVDSRAFLD